MASRRSISAGVVFRLIAVLSLVRSVAGAYSQQLCSTENTGSSSTPTYNKYQSNGACHDTCIAGSYAFAIVQATNCWCSNYAPSDTTSTTNCNVNCPGFPYEQCGNFDQNLYGYIALSNAPSGTIGASTSTSAAASSSSDSSSGSTSQGPSTVTVTASPTANTSSTLTSTSSTSSTSTTTSSSSTTTTSSSKSTSSWTPTPVTMVTTVTGQVQTITITPSKPPALATTLPVAVGKKHALSGGQIAGLVIGLLIFVGLILGLVLFCLRQRRNSGQTLGDESGSNHSDEMFNSSGSRSSMNGLMGRTGTQSEKRMLPRIATNVFGGGNITPPEKSHSPEERRHSQPILMHDQRLDPISLLRPEDDASSRVSIRSLRDDRDYSRRVLKIHNPDD